MSARNRPKSRRPLPVLHVSTDQVEWLGTDRSGECVHGTRAVESDSPADIARTASELMTELGSKAGPCVLALGRGVLEQRVVSFPEAPRKDLREVIKRKAANLLTVSPKETLFCALSMSAGSSAGSAAEHKWLLLCQRRAFVTQLSMQLRRRGFRVRNVVSARMAALCKAQSLRGDTESACIVVSIWARSATVSLICGEELVNQSVVEGDFGTQPSLAATLIQEVRSFESFWRKVSRGRELGQICVMGLDAESAHQLEPAIRAAIQDVEIFVLPEREDERPDAGRIESLDACRYEGAFQVDLTLPIAPRTTAVAAASLAVALVAAAAGVVGWNRIEAERGTIDSETERLLAQTADLEQLELTNQHITSQVAALDESFERAIQLGQLGLPMKHMIEDAAAAFDRRATLLHLAAIVDQLEARGVTDPNPMASMLALDDLRRRLESSIYFEYVTLVPPTDVPEGKEDEASTAGDAKESAWLEFSVEGYLEGQGEEEESEDGMGAADE